MSPQPALAPLLEEMAETIADYQFAEFGSPTPEHVERWIRQFPAEQRAPILRELNHVFRTTYFSSNDILEFLDGELTHTDLTGARAVDFWRGVDFLRIQNRGASQSDLLGLLDLTMQERMGFDTSQCGGSGTFLYLDDVVFSGARVHDDVSRWTRESAPDGARLIVLTLASHAYGEWDTKRRLQKCAKDARKQIAVEFWTCLRLENRLTQRAASEVLWPATIPESEALATYMALEERFPFQPRPLRAEHVEHRIFSSENGRQVLESQLLLAGVRIRGFCHEPSDWIRPLGFSNFGLGFGSTIATFRNCPNNAPLALWWGDPRRQGHPLSRWYPLLPRITYGQREEG